MPNGVKHIQSAVTCARKTEKIKDAQVKFYIIEAPKYSVEAEAENRKRAEEVLQTVGQAVVANISKQGGSGSFKKAK
jgi:translation initiation factor 2 alpha subunit (eIF-2alpha)